MSKKRWTLAGSVAGVAALLVLGWFFFLRPQETWPGFSEAKGPAPAIEVKHDERNFGYRIGDVVPMTLYIKQFPGTTVEVEGLVLDGDFELRGDMKVESHDTADGGKLFRIQVKLQSFANNDHRQTRVSVAWYENGKPSSQTLAESKFVVHGSKTWDGQPAIQEGRPEYVQGWHLVKTLAIGIGSLAVVVIAVVYIRWQILLLPLPKPKKPAVTREQWAKARFDAAWAHIASGDRDPIWFRRITVTMRRYVGADAVLWTQLPNALRNYAYQRQALIVIGLCERVIFKADVLSEEELLALHKAFHDIVEKR